MLLGFFEGGFLHFECDELVSALLETGDDISYESTLDSVGLYCDEGTFGVGHGVDLTEESCAKDDWQ